MRYKVFDTVTKQYITDDRLILKPDGRLALNDYGDEIGLPNCIAMFYPTDKDDNWIDEVGGTHDSGTGWDPDGNFCGECYGASCRTCGVWKPNSSTLAALIDKFADTTTGYIVTREELQRALNDEKV